MGPTQSVDAGELLRQSLADWAADPKVAYHSTAQHGLTSAGKVSALAYDAESQLVAIGTSHGAIKLVAGSGVETHLGARSAERILALYFLRGKGRLVSVSKTAVRVWELELESVALSIDLPGVAVSCATLPDAFEQRFLYLGTTRGDIIVFDCAEQRLSKYEIKLAQLLKGYGGGLPPGGASVTAMAAKPQDDSQFLVALSNGAMLSWNLPHRRVHRHYRGLRSGVVKAGGSKGGGAAASAAVAAGEGDVVVAAAVAADLAGAYVNAVCWEPGSGLHFACGLSNGEVVIYRRKSNAAPVARFFVSPTIAQRHPVFGLRWLGAAIFVSGGHVRVAYKEADLKQQRQQQPAARPHPSRSLALQGEPIGVRMCLRRERNDDSRWFCHSLCTPLPWGADAAAAAADAADAKIQEEEEEEEEQEEEQDARAGAASQAPSSAAELYASMAASPEGGDVSDGELSNASSSSRPHSRSSSRASLASTTDDEMSDSAASASGASPMSSPSSSSGAGGEEAVAVPPLLDEDLSGFIQRPAFLVLPAPAAAQNPNAIAVMYAPADGSKTVHVSFPLLPVPLRPGGRVTKRVTPWVAPLDCFMQDVLSVRICAAGGGAALLRDRMEKAARVKSGTAAAAEAVQVKEVQVRELRALLRDLRLGGRLQHALMWEAAEEGGRKRRVAPVPHTTTKEAEAAALELKKSVSMENVSAAAAAAAASSASSASSAAASEAPATPQKAKGSNPGAKYQTAPSSPPSKIAEQPAAAATCEAELGVPATVILPWLTRNDPRRSLSFALYMQQRWRRLMAAQGLWPLGGSGSAAAVQEEDEPPAPCLIVTGHTSGLVNFWDATSPYAMELLFSLDLNMDASVNASYPLSVTHLEFDVAKRLLAVACLSGDLWVYRFKEKFRNEVLETPAEDGKGTRKELLMHPVGFCMGLAATMRHPVPLDLMAVSLHTGRVAVADRLGGVSLHDLHTGEEVMRRAPPAGDAASATSVKVTAVHIGPVGVAANGICLPYVFFGHANGAIRCYNATSGSALPPLLAELPRDEGAAEVPFRVPGKVTFIATVGHDGRPLAVNSYATYVSTHVRPAAEAAAAAAPQPKPSAAASLGSRLRGTLTGRQSAAAAAAAQQVQHPHNASFLVVAAGSIVYLLHLDPATRLVRVLRRRRVSSEQSISSAALVRRHGAGHLLAVNDVRGQCHLYSLMGLRHLASAFHPPDLQLGSSTVSCSEDGRLVVLNRHLSLQRISLFPDAYHGWTAFKPDVYSGDDLSGDAQGGGGGQAEGKKTKTGWFSKLVDSSAQLLPLLAAPRFVESPAPKKHQQQQQKARRSSSSRSKREQLLGSKYTKRKVQDRKGDAQAQVASTQAQMAQARQRAQERGERLNEVANKSEDMAAHAQDFYEMAKALRKKQSSSFF